MAGELFIGLMSGTSLDGVDAVLVQFNEAQQPHVLQTKFLAYPSELREQILALQHPTDNELESTALIGIRLAKLYADAVNQLLANARFSPNKITAIGCHGQTIRHRPELGFTLQIGNPAILAELTGITVVADFRSRDIAAGGQGAPLVPAFHQAIFAHPIRNRAVINIGGIANITYLENNNPLIGFDSGPGNMLLDAWIKRHKNLNYDANGAWARTGQAIKPLLSSMLAEPYFTLVPPKSTGRDLFNDTWVDHHLAGRNYSPQDVAFTMVSLTAQSIYAALLQHCSDFDEVYLCGGGSHNILLVQQLQRLLGDIKVETTDKLGVNVDWVEAIAFAWLAVLCLNQKTASLPEVTGAKGPRILGAIYQH
jgi:anhydro-N-acetylmuramic acid kinase